MNDFDSPWKEALDWYFEAFLAYFFPLAHADIDWSRGHDFLDKELLQIMKDAELGRRVVDKLVKVYLKNGEEEWILIHIEIQTQAETDFGQRIFVYSYRLFDRYNRKVVSLAVLADDHADWKPESFGYTLWGFEIGVRFPVVKLLEFASRADELAQHDNPFAIVVLAHLKALETRGNPQDRRVWKMILVKNLYERGWSGDDIRKLFRFIDWIMDLPEELKKSFWQEFHEYEEKKQMPYVTSVERIGHARGLREGIEVVLKLRFGEEGLKLMPEIEEISNEDRLREILKVLQVAASPDEVRRTWTPSVT